MTIAVSLLQKFLPCLRFVYLFCQKHNHLMVKTNRVLPQGRQNLSTVNETNAGQTRNLCHSTYTVNYLHMYHLFYFFSQGFIPAAKAAKVVVRVMGSALSNTQKTHIKFLGLYMYDNVHRVAQTSLNCISSVYL